MHVNDRNGIAEARLWCFRAQRGARVRKCSINSSRGRSRTPPLHQQNTTSVTLQISHRNTASFALQNLTWDSSKHTSFHIIIALLQKWPLISVTSRFLAYLPHHRKFVIMAGDKGTTGGSITTKDGTVMNQGDVEFLIACIQHTSGGQLTVSKHSSSKP